MSLLKTEPAEPVRSLAELFAIAYAMEDEAAARYHELAVKTREHGALATAAVFERLAEEERRHRDKVADWSKERSGKAPNVSDIRWHIPETFDDETTGDIAGSRLVTPYRTLSLAVRNEERAFALWSYIAARAEDAAVRDAAEAMAREELEHVSVLRRERRRAYHAAGGGRDRSAERITPAAALTEAADLEVRLAEQLDDLRRTQSTEVQARLGELAAQARQMAKGTIASAARVTGAAPVGLMTFEEILATAEYLLERYLEVADHATDEIIMNRAQDLARGAITRLASLRAIKERTAR